MTTGSWLDDRPDVPEDPERDGARRRRDRRILLWLVVAVLAVVGGVYVAGHLMADNRLPRATTVAGVDVGGLTPRQAQAELRRSLADEASQPVVVAVGDREFDVDPEAVGLEVDAAASIEQVPVGESWSPADIWESFVGGEEYDAVTLSVDGLVEERLAEIAEEVDEPPVEGTIRFRGARAVPVYPESGRSVDVDAAVEAIRASYPSGDVVELPVGTDRSEVGGREVSATMRDFANPAMSAPVVYDFGSEEVRLTPARFARALSFEAVDGELEPQVDRKRLLAAFAPAARTVGEEPVDATVRIVDGRPEIVPGKKGAAIDEDKIVDGFLDLVVAEGDDRTLQMDTKLVAPEVGTKEVRSWGIEEEVSEFTTSYPHADYRNTNIGRAAELIDGTVLAPGETFSMNETVGERTEANGFTEGFIISDGVFKEELGGGVSQVATTTYNAAYFAGLKDVEHKAHSFYIDRYPVGREATLVFPVVDLKFQNDTDHGVLIQTLHSPSAPGGTGSVTVRMWSTKTWDIESITGERYNYTSPATRTSTDEDCYPNDGYGGFTIDVTRVFREPGSSEVVKRETETTVYTPSDTVICR